MSVRFLIVRRIQGDRHHGKQTDMSICSQSIGRYTIVFGKIFCLQYIFWARIWDFCCPKRGWMHVAEISGFRSLYVLRRNVVQYPMDAFVFFRKIYFALACPCQKGKLAAWISSRKKRSQPFPCYFQRREENPVSVCWKDRKMDGSSAGFCGAWTKIFFQRW